MPPGERRGTGYTRTRSARILPFALSKLEEKNATYMKNKATIWWALYEYFPALKNKIGADTVNLPINAITLNSIFDEELGQFTFGFQATNEEHKYRIEILEEDSHYTTQLPTVVTFAQHDTDVPRPDPDILDVHLRIARILKVSGTGLAVQESLWRYEGHIVYNIASDGSTDLERILSDKMLMGI
ncbi:hypothetical protein B0H67DRAFT_658412 [Lasiosphaeris hirsuta]|uniref:HNH nuclease domain-containing protein n=1 Tax=Lasiosphaeris hirsuta TaxID=260670 RepID=A0AA40E4W1_9PEZI|nr:hypothetical protein B0H67DRAFT_658412 [Lasiosphaeris hirsuta]